jgi:hypothetical protein
MKKLFAFTALCLFGTLPSHASEPSLGRPMLPVDQKPDAPVLSGLGRLRPAAYEPTLGWSTAGLPRWQVQIGGQTYYLVFHGKKDLEQLVEKNRQVWWWKVRGRVERRNFTLYRQPARPGDPVFTDARILALNVLVVESLEPTLLEGRRIAEPVRMTVRAEIKWFGNSYCREPNGVISGTCKWCPWEGCYIELEGRRVRVQGLPGDIVDQQGYRGQTLVLVGRLERQQGCLRMLPDVLVVESFQRG